MNSLRMRLVILKPLYGAGDDFKHAIQISQDGLNWWTIFRGKEVGASLEMARGLEKFIQENRLVKDESILWTAKSL